MGWDLIGGNPAPGSVDAVSSAQSALQVVADLASEARLALIRDTSALGVERWKGTAAAEFRATIGELPARLGDVDTSYRQASQALTTFHDRLVDAQTRAGQALSAAEAAEGDRSRAQGQRNTAEATADDLRSRERSALWRLTTARAQQAVTIDPAQRPAADRAVTTARAALTRAEADAEAARQEVDRFAAAVSAAEGRLKDAKNEALAIRALMKLAVDDAVAALQTAKESGDLPNWLERTFSDAKDVVSTATDWLAEHADDIKAILQAVQLVCTVVSMVFPAAAPVLMTVSLVAGVVILAVDLVKTAKSAEGFSGANLWELGGDVLGVVGAAAGLGAVTKAASASAGFGAVSTSLRASQDLAAAQRLSTVATWAGYGEDAMSVGKGYADNGLQGAVFAAGTAYVGHKAASVAGEGIRGAVSTARGSHAVRSDLEAMSLSLKAEDPTPNLVHSQLDGLPSTQGMRSVLTSGHGGVIQQQIGESYAEDLGEAITEHYAGEFNDYGQDLLTEARGGEPEPEIEIDLSPYQYGGGR